MNMRIKRNPNGIDIYYCKRCHHLMASDKDAKNLDNCRHEQRQFTIESVFEAELLDIKL